MRNSGGCPVGLNMCGRVKRPKKQEEKKDSLGTAAFAGLLFSLDKKVWQTANGGIGFGVRGLRNPCLKLPWYLESNYFRGGVSLVKQRTPSAEETRLKK